MTLILNTSNTSNYASVAALKQSMASKTQNFTELSQMLLLQLQAMPAYQQVQNLYTLPIHTYFQQFNLDIGQCKPTAQDKKYVLAHALQIRTTQLIAYNKPVNLLQISTYLQAYYQLTHDLPLAYILGTAPFADLMFNVNEFVLIPRLETELLLSKSLEYLKKIAVELKQPLQVLELGCGSGALSIALKLKADAVIDLKDLQVDAVDICPQALQIAQENAQLHNCNIHFQQSNWFGIFANSAKKWHVIISNPPYIASQDAHLKQSIRYEPRQALTDELDGLNCYRMIIQEANKYLQTQGYLILEHGYDQAQAIQGLLQQANFEHIETILDDYGQPRVTLGKKVIE